MGFTVGENATGAAINDSILAARHGFYDVAPFSAMGLAWYIERWPPNNGNNCPKNEGPPPLPPPPCPECERKRQAAAGEAARTKLRREELRKEYDRGLKGESERRGGYGGGRSAGGGGGADWSHKGELDH